MIIDQPSGLVFPHISNHPDDQPPGLVAVGPSQPGGWTRFHSPLHRRRRSDQSLVKAGSRLPSTDSPPRLLSALTPRSLCVRLSPLPIVLGSTYKSPKVMLVTILLIFISKSSSQFNQYSQNLILAQGWNQESWQPIWKLPAKYFFFN